MLQSQPLEYKAADFSGQMQHILPLQIHSATDFQVLTSLGVWKACNSDGNPIEVKNF